VESVQDPGYMDDLADHSRRVREVVTTKHGKTCSIDRSGLQVPLSTEMEGFIRPVSHRATAIEDVLIHILGNAVAGNLGRKWGFWDGLHPLRASHMQSQCTLAHKTDTLSKTRSTVSNGLELGKMANQFRSHSWH
jgi:hypothetical protein